MKIELSSFEIEDLDRLMSWIQSPKDLHDWAGLFFRYPLERSQMENYVATDSDPSAQRRIFKATDISSGNVVGHLELSHIWPGLSGRMSRVLVGESGLRGQGIGTAMVTKLKEYAFSEYSFHRLDVGVSKSNKQAITCYKKAGFETVGIWPDAMETSTGTIHVVWLSTFKSA